MTETESSVDAPIADERLMALADGELSDEEAEALHAVVVADPALAARFALFAETRALLRERGSSPGAVPAPLLAAIRSADGAAAGRPALTVIEGDARRSMPSAATSPRRPERAARWSLPLAACLALAVGGGLGFWGSRLAPTSPSVGLAGIPVMRGELDRALGSLASGSRAGAISMLASYRLGDGTICREYDLSGSGASGTAGGWTGIDCRRGGRWSTEMLAQHLAPAEGYVPANGHALVESFFSSRQAAGPLDTETERTLLAR